MSNQDSTPKLHIDSDWKAEAQKEKERLAQKEQTRTAKSATAVGAAGATGSKQAGTDQELPPANFRSLVGMLASQAIMGLGAMADPETNRVIIDLEGARFAIDMLDVLEQKTKGNLTDDEHKELTQILAELRSRFVQIAQLVARQMAAQSPNPVGVVPGPAVSPVQPAIR